MARGEFAERGGAPAPFVIRGRLDGRVLRLSYQFGERNGDIEVVGVGEYQPPRLSLFDRLEPRASY